MNTIEKRIDSRDWAEITSELHDNGYVVVSSVLSVEECDMLKSAYDAEGTYRKTISMERYRFGKGEYRYFRYPLPSLIAEMREAIYPRLVSVANRWMEELGLPNRFPARHEDLLELCRSHGQTLPTVLILKYSAGGYNTLHQDLYGEVYFPFQVVFMLDDIGVDYTGGEFVLVEQVPRAQSKANVLTPGIGDMIIFTTNFRPVKGGRGYYRANMKHGVSPVRGGGRYSLGIIFHDAQQ